MEPVFMAHQRRAEDQALRALLADGLTFRLEHQVRRNLSRQDTLEADDDEVDGEIDEGYSLDDVYSMLSELTAENESLRQAASSSADQLQWLMQQVRALGSEVRRLSLLIGDLDPDS